MKARTPAKAELQCLDKPSLSFVFPFNPEAGSMKLARSVGWSAEGNGYDPWGGPLDYQSGDPDELRFTILLDETTLGEPDLADASAFEAALLSAISILLPTEENTTSVLARLENLWELTKPIKPDGHTDDSYDVRPPVVAFVWEAFVFLGAVTSLDADILVVDETGRPKRAEVDISMKGRAFAGKTTLADFLTANDFTPDAAETGTGSDTAQTRDDLLGSIL